MNNNSTTTTNNGKNKVHFYISFFTEFVFQFMK